MTALLTIPCSSGDCDQPCEWGALEAFLSRVGADVQASEFMSMGEKVHRIDGVEVLLLDFKHHATRNYLTIDALALGAWNFDGFGQPRPMPASSAIAHATTFGHTWADGCRTAGAMGMTTEAARLDRFGALL